MVIPDAPKINQEQAFTNLLESIAKQESALAAFINAEAEKSRALMLLYKGGRGSRTLTSDQLIEFQRNLSAIINTAFKTHMIIQSMLEMVLEASQRKDGTPLSIPVERILEEENPFSK